MKIRVHPGDQRAVGHLRLIWPAEQAREHGTQVEVSDHIPLLRRGDGSLIGPQHIDADLIVVQRPSHPDMIALIPMLQARGIAVVVDVDDDLASLPTRNAAHGAENHRLILQACARADRVTVTTHALARRYASHGRVTILPNCLPERVLQLPAVERDGMTVGWGGWTGTHPYDLEATHGGVAQAIDRAHARFHVIGPAGEVQARLGLTDPPSATGPLTNVVGLEFEQALARLDVGIVPLADSTFNQSKSTLKGVQYAARGVPFIASPLPEYERLAAQGAGIITANRGRSWRSSTLSLLADPAYRTELAERGMRVVEDHYLLERQAWRWVEAWSEAHRHRQAAGCMVAA